MSFLSQTELISMNFKYLGKNVKVSDKASIYNPHNIYLDDDCRIDDFCILSAGEKGIHIGRFVHIACYCSLIGAEKIYLSDFSGISSRVSIYSSSDDYSGTYMTNPTIPKELTKIDSRPVFLDKHTIIGAGSVVLPGAKLNLGVAVGSLSLIQGKEYPEFMIYFGNPAKPIKKRKRNLLELENFLNNKANENELPNM